MNGKETPLATVIDVKHGFAFPGDRIRDEPPGDILHTRKFCNRRRIPETSSNTSDGEVPQDYVLNEGDLVVTMTDLE